jgi:hypothetical protein
MRHGAGAGGRAGLWQRWAYAIRQFLYGMTTYEMVRGLERERLRLGWQLAALTQAGALGIPLPGNCYGLRLLPYLLPELQSARRALARAHDIIDLCEDLG